MAWEKKKKKKTVCLMMFARMGTVICNKSYNENISLQKQEMENPYFKKYIYILHN